MNAALIGLGMLAVIGPWGDRAQVQVAVVDGATGDVLPGLHVTGSFEIERKPTWKDASNSNLEEAITDEQGSCKLSGVTELGRVWCFVRPVPKAYYGWNGVAFEFKERNLLGAWQPDNLVATIRLDRVEHPIPLFVKELKPKGKQNLSELPEGTCGYDLMKGDWLPPLGKGKYADIEVTCHPREDLGEGKNGRGDVDRSYRDRATVRFTGEGNGLVEMKTCSSSGILIRTAPEGGYVPEYQCWKQRGSDLQWSESDDRDRHFCFRIRTRKDDAGRIVEAYYGKIYHDIAVYTVRGPLATGVHFLYYLNPTSLDRNLEWDLRSNLCTRGGAKAALP